MRGRHGANRESGRPRARGLDSDSETAPRGGVSQAMPELIDPYEIRAGESRPVKLEVVQG